MNTEANKVTVIKLNTQREETWRYQGRILARDAQSILIEAFFNREDLDFHDITLREKDRFLERYYDNRWYNIFEIHDREDDHLKAWYCNVTTPAEFSSGKIAYIDLALDLLVYPEGHFLVLDEAEFEDLNITDESRNNARLALETLINLATSGKLHQALND